jgi:hypothetical protein
VLGAIKVGFGIATALASFLHLGSPLSQPAVNAPSGPLFTAGAPLAPGRAVDRTFLVSTTDASYLGLYMTGLESSCEAPDAASRLHLTVLREGKAIYEGDVASFAAQHSAPPSALEVKPGEFDFRVRLDPEVDNSYQGCSSQVDVHWVVAQ